MSISVGLSGLRATSEQMNSISHNIANVGTVGFKSSRTEFQDVYAPQFGGGEMNGVEVAQVRQSFTSGGTTSTGRNSDLAINGEGFFMVQNNGQQMFTRNGVFNLDTEGYLVSGDGYRLQGYGVTSSGQIQTGTVTDLKVDTSDMAAKVSSKINQGLNLDANAKAIDSAKVKFDPEDPQTFTSSVTSTIYDSLGSEHQLTQYYVKTDKNQWEIHYKMDDKVLADKNTVSFDADGKVTDESALNLNLTFDNGAKPQALALTMKDVTQYGSEFSINKNASDGHAPGQIAGWYFEGDGTVYARYSNGQTKAQGQVLMARFPNQEGLQQAGGTRWTQSFASGAPLLGTPGTGQMGALRTGMYENSNVNLTNEMVSLMSAQSNYQANAKTIKVSQEMTQILFQNL
ncbi:flagellar biosynthesis protein FlgE [Photobacterium jeanii]|uniref:Flagellar hook protein FlgE n=1 Tax=Photobacterium jeanii TaxID=858640 RepID=A0A178KJ32_9GAMM|nr:flagellar hook protein FlgE [Photobacterium jeanii]OAN16714.1 flagellar biosynthesis protein FlgE [Photobacterium jeanii]PST87443.1 flagellar biosynthesis protein FlgE [Photobacterium jeanii]